MDQRRASWGLNVIGHHFVPLFSSAGRRAWEWLKANSALLVGTAWELLTHPKQSGTGFVLNDGFTVEVGDTFEVELAPAYEVEISTAPFEVFLVPPVVASVQDLPLTAELVPGTTVEVP